MTTTTLATGVRAERGKSAESVQPRVERSRGCYLLSANAIRRLCPREGAIGPPIRERLHRGHGDRSIPSYRFDVLRFGLGFKRAAASVCSAGLFRDAGGRSCFAPGCEKRLTVSHPYISWARERRTWGSWMAGRRTRAGVSWTAEQGLSRVVRLVVDTAQHCRRRRPALVNAHGHALDRKTRRARDPRLVAPSPGPGTPNQAARHRSGHAARSSGPTGGAAWLPRPTDRSHPGLHPRDWLRRRRYRHRDRFAVRHPGCRPCRTR